MKYTYDYSKLLGRLREMGLTQSDLAGKIGISVATLNQKFKNKTEFKQTEIAKILSAVNVDMASVDAYFFNH